MVLRGINGIDSGLLKPCNSGSIINNLFIFMKGIIFSCTIHYKPVFRQAQSIDMWNLHTFFDKTSPDYTQDKGKEKQNR